MRAENPNCIVVESGNLAYSLNPSNPTVQLEPVADSLRLMDYTAVGVGMVDMRMGESYYSTLKQKGIPVVHVDMAPHAVAQPYVVKQIDGVRVGIVSFGAVVPQEANSFQLLKQRYKTLVEARAKSDILILLDQANVATDDWLQRNAGRFNGPDLVIGGTARAALSAPRQIDCAMVVPTSRQGTYVGRVDIEIDDTGKKMRFSRTLLDAAVQDNQDVLRIVKDYTLAQSKAFARTAASTYQPASEAFFSHASCKSCHSAEYEQWKGTRHASALSTLVKENKTIGECLPCHSESFKRTRTAQLTGAEVGGVECMSCHASVLPHGADFKKKGDTAAIRAQCAACHTKERSPNFNLDVAYEAVKHVRR